jgi:hypothetical protein
LPINLEQSNIRNILRFFGKKSTTIFFQFYFKG